MAWHEFNESLGEWFLSYSHNPQAQTRPLYTPLAQCPLYTEPVESVLIDGRAYTIPAAVAGEMLRLHLEIQQGYKDGPASTNNLKQ